MARDDSFKVSAAVAVVLVAAFLALTGMRPAEAAFPGANGRIAYDANGDILLTDANGVDSFHVNLTNSAGATDYNASMSPDGRKVAFQSNRDGVDNEIYTLDIYTGALTQVTNNTVQDGNPAWSPDGTRIAFERSRSALSRSLGIYTVTTTGTGPRRLTFGNDSEPNWSPDGTKLVFFSYDSGTDTYTISTVNATGSGQTPLTSGSFLVSPVFSPDDTKIAYYGIESGVPGYQVHVRNADGSGTPTALTSEGNNFSPDWRPGP